MTLNAIETIAKKNGLESIEANFIESVLDTFQKGSEQVTEAMPWDSSARARLSAVPSMVRGMLIQEIECQAAQSEQEQVGPEFVEQIIDQWRDSGQFHLDPDDPRNSS